VLSFIIPGLGQIYQGRIGKGLLFMVSLLGMFTLGQAMGNWQNVYIIKGPPGAGAPGALRTLNVFGGRWQYAGQFWIGAAAWPAIWQVFREPDPPGVAPSFWREFQKEPDENKVNEFLVNSDKTPDLGWVYTVIAGMLNLLVMYDAYAGPMIVAGPRSSSKPSLLPGSEPKKEGAA
jgi:hypothetical protein